MEIVYGIDVSDEGNEFLHSADEVLRLSDLAFEPGGFLVDLFPSRMFTLGYVTLVYSSLGFICLVSETRTGMVSWGRISADCGEE